MMKESCLEAIGYICQDIVSSAFHQLLYAKLNALQIRFLVIQFVWTFKYNFII